MRIKANEITPFAYEDEDDGFYEEDSLWGGPLETPPSVPEESGKKITTMKIVVWFCLLNGVAWVWFSYILAWKGREQIAETLSQVALTEIIGVVLVYAVKSLFENLSKNNSWPDKRSKKRGGNDEEVS